MTITDIDIVNFKNIAGASLSFSPKVNCLLGRNGMGKSNLLEAIHFLSFARPVSPMPESALIRHGEELLMVKGDYTMDSGARERVACGITRGKGKSLKLNGKEYQRISNHIGRFPLVTVAPQDSQLVTGGGEERRKLMDMVISQADGSYLSELIRYNRALESRNRMLRAGMRDALLYESVESSLAGAAAAIYAARDAWTRAIQPDFERYYCAVSGDSERATIGYRSVLAGTDMHQVLAACRGKDAALGYTSRGVHRDDLDMGLDGYSMRRLGSQGQVKTFTIALRLAIFDYLRRAGGQTPLLLLDDIFDKLDASRVGNIMRLVGGVATPFGQIFITDTNRKHLDEILSALDGDHRLFEVTDGEFRLMEAPAVS